MSRATVARESDYNGVFVRAGLRQAGELVAYTLARSCFVRQDLGVAAKSIGEERMQCGGVPYCRREPVDSLRLVSVDTDEDAVELHVRAACLSTPQA